MDVVVVDVPPKFGMMLSRSWKVKLKGKLQMDLFYTTIHIFHEQIRLYRENRLAYMISNKENLENYPIYFVDIDMGSSMLFNDSFSHKSEHGPSESASDETNQHSAETKEKHEHHNMSPTPKEIDEG